LNDEKLDSSDRASYLFNTSISGIEEADACLIIGANVRLDAPILNARIRKRSLSKKLKIAAVGVDSDLTYNYEKLGSDIKILQEILDEKNHFAEVLKASKKPMLILGSDVVSRNDGEVILAYAKKIAEKFNMIQDGWNGFNFLAKSTGLINGLEVGFTAAKSEDIFAKCKNGEVKAVILHGVDDIDFEKLKDVFVIYIGTHGDRAAHVADVILPAAAYSEKDAIYVNLEGRAQSTKRAVFAPGNAKEDLTIFIELAKKFGFDLGFKNLVEARKSLASLNPVFAHLDQITKAVWKKSADVKSDFAAEKIAAKNYDFYLTGAIARASRILNRCSAELQNE